MANLLKIKECAKSKRERGGLCFLSGHGGGGGVLHEAGRDERKEGKMKCKNGKFSLI